MMLSHRKRSPNTTQMQPTMMVSTARMDNYHGKKGYYNQRRRENICNHQGSWENIFNNLGRAENAFLRRRMTPRMTTAPYHPPEYHPLAQHIKQERPPSPTINPSVLYVPPSDGAAVNELVPIDFASHKGKFGWALIGQEYMPFILRRGERFVPVRMMETHIFNSHLSVLHPDIYKCTTVRSFYPTVQEAKLLSIINQDHTDHGYGKPPFTTSELLVTLADAQGIFQFLTVCYNKLLNPLNKRNSHCGFMRLDGDSVIAYASKNDEKYVPLFYFDGISDELRQNTYVLDGWELAYLKFCCRIQGIKKEFLEDRTCAVVKLSEIEAHFPPESKFQEFWLPRQSLSFLSVSRYAC